MSLSSLERDYNKTFGVKKTKKHRHRKSKLVYGQGWNNESERHQMARYGIKTGRKKRQYQPKSQFLSKPYIDAGVGGIKFVVGGVKKVNEIRKANAEKARLAKEKREAEERRKEDYYDGKVTPAKKPIENNVPFVEDLKKRQAESNYRKAQENALKQRDEQYSQVIEARKRRQEQMDKDYASV